MSKKLRKEFARKLNSDDPKVVHSAEWELVIFDWLSGCGDTQYEVEQNNGKKPDISFYEKSLDIEFIADIATVSDDRIDKEFPASKLIHQVGAILRRVTGGRYSFDIRLESSESGNLVMFAPARMMAHLTRFEEWAINNIYQFQQGASIIRDIEGNALVINVNAKINYSVGSYPARVYKQEHRRNNPVFSALDSKSSKQLPKSDDRLIGIILCDGGCRILNSFHRAWNEVSLREIIDAAISEHSNIDFVIALSLGTAFSINQLPQIKLESFINIGTSERKIEMSKRLISMVSANSSSLCRPLMYPYQSKQEILSKKNKLCYWHFCSDECDFARFNTALT